MRLILGLLAAVVAGTQPVSAQTTHLRLHVIRLADSDGSRAAAITPAEMAQWVAEANAALARSSAGIKVHFVAKNPGPDWEFMKNTTLNQLSSGGNGWSAGNAVAAQHPDKVVVFVRHGDATDATGNGFAFPPQSDANVNFVALPGFLKTWIVVDAFNGPSVQNRWVFGHELGHYLGLGHTFPGWHDLDTDTHAEAAALIAKHGGKASALDGDSVPDTPPEAGTQYYRVKGWKMCSGPASYTVSATGAAPFSHKFAPMRDNMMSYFVCGSPRFTYGQIGRIYQTLKSPRRSAVAHSQPPVPDVDLVTQPPKHVDVVPPSAPATPKRVPDIRAKDQDKAPAAPSRPRLRVRVPPPPPDSTRTPMKR